MTKPFLRLRDRISLHIFTVAPLQFQRGALVDKMTVEAAAKLTDLSEREKALVAILDEPVGECAIQ